MALRRHGIIMAGSLLAAVTVAGCSEPPTRGDTPKIPVDTLPPVSYDSIWIVPLDPALSGDAGLALGGSTPLRAMGRIAGEALPLSNASWQTSDTSVLKVAPDGVVTGLRAGTADVIVTAGSKVARRFIGVWAVDSIYIHHAGPDIRSSLHGLVTGSSAQKSIGFHAVGTRTPPPIVGVTVSWSSGNPEVATINSSGRLQAHSRGTTLITVRTSVTTRGPAVDSQLVVVVDAPLTTASIDPAPDSVHRLLVPISGRMHGDMPRVPKARVVLQGPFTFTANSGPGYSPWPVQFERQEDGTIRWSTRFRNVRAGIYQATVTVWDSIDLATSVQQEIRVVDPEWQFTQHTIIGDFTYAYAENGYAAGRDYPGPALWKDSTKTFLPAPLAGTYVPTAVNRHGVAVGYYQRSVTGRPTPCLTAVRWQGGEVELLTSLDSCDQVPVDINDRGDVLLTAPAALLTAEGELPLPAMTARFVDEQRRVVGTVAQGELSSVVTWQPGASGFTATGLVVRMILDVSATGLLVWETYPQGGLFSLFGEPIPGHLAPLADLNLRPVAINDAGTVVASSGTDYYVVARETMERIPDLVSGRLTTVQGLLNDGVVYGRMHPAPQAGVTYPVRLFPR